MTTQSLFIRANNKNNINLNDCAINEFVSLFACIGNMITFKLYTVIHE